ncbi:DUF441 family protein, partial [Escherichia coli]|uniref:DUF441 family protein n=1 Tax=Escherichia coli TaxID=562 RepID=UPI0002AE17B0
LAIVISALLVNAVGIIGFIGLFAPLLAKMLGGRGVTLMGSQPQLVAGLLVGTVLGVALFRGVPVGPLIATGLVSLIVGKQ